MVSQFMGRSPEVVATQTEEVVVEQAVVLLGTEVDAIGGSIETAVAGVAYSSHAVHIVAIGIVFASDACTVEERILHVLDALPVVEHADDFTCAPTFCLIHSVLQRSGLKVEYQCLGLQTEHVLAHQVSLETGPVVVGIALGEVEVALHGAAFDVNRNVGIGGESRIGRAAAVGVVHLVEDEAVAAACYLQGVHAFVQGVLLSGGLSVACHFERHALSAGDSADVNLDDVAFIDPDARRVADGLLRRPNE